MRTRVAVALLALLCGLGSGAITGAGARPSKHCHRHHHHRRCKKEHHHVTTNPTTNTTTTTTTTGGLPSRLEVDENDTPSYSLTPSHNPVATGTVTFNVYNFGQDEHTFAVENSFHHQLAFAPVPAGQTQIAVTVSASLPPGTYTLLCTLSNHAALGMRATLTVQ